MANTITSSDFYVFTAATPALASEVNSNFTSRTRGDVIPMEETTITGSNLSHDLGAPDHIWAEGYIKDLYFGGRDTLTSRWWIKGTSGSAIVGFDSTTVLTIDASTGLSDTFKSGAFTSSASLGQIALSSTFTYDVTSPAFVASTASAITLVSSGNPIHIQLIQGTATAGIDTISALYVYSLNGGTGTGFFRFEVDSSSTGLVTWLSVDGSTVTAFDRAVYSPTSVDHYLFGIAAGSHTYRLALAVGVTGSGSRVTARHIRMMAREIF